MNFFEVAIALYGPGVLAVLKVALTTYLLTVLLYAGYLAYCTANRLKDSGRLAELPWVVRGHMYAIVYVALILDILFNVIVGSLVFVEAPEIRRLTFTARCKKWKTYVGPATPLVRWRIAVAVFVCDSWLNPGEPGHC